MSKPGGVGIDDDRVFGERDGEFVAHLLDEGATRLHRAPHHRRQLHTLPAKFDLAPTDAAHIHQVVHQPNHLLKLPLHHAAGELDGRGVVTGKLYHLQPVADRSQRIAQLVGKRGQELVFFAVSFS